MKTYLITSTLLFACLISLKSQEILVPDSLIGMWMYKGPSQIELSDTIEIVKVMSTDNSHELWTFKPYGNRLEITLKSNSNEPNRIIATKIDNKWFYNNKTKTLTLEFSDYTQQFRIVKSNNHFVRLLRIE